MIGLHDHHYYTAAGGRAAQLTYSAPRLYLGSGVTTVRTTGSQQPYAELNLKDEIEKGNQPGPRIHITAPYITGGSGASTMTFLRSPEQARRFVRYWAAEGATWLKAYTNIRSAELGAAIAPKKHGKAWLRFGLRAVGLAVAMALLGWGIITAANRAIVREMRPSVQRMAWSLHWYHWPSLVF